MGEFIQWLYRRVPVYGHILDGEWWDIGDIKSYKSAIEALSRRLSHPVI